MSYNRSRELERIDCVIKTFLSDKPRKKKFGNYRIDPLKRLSYFSRQTDSKNWTYEEQNALNVVKKEFNDCDDLATVLKPRYGKLTVEIESVIAIFSTENEDENCIIVNNDILPEIGKSCSYGHTNYNRTKSIIQNVLMQSKCTLNVHNLSFSQLTKNNYNIDSLELITSDSKNNRLYSVMGDNDQVNLLVNGNDIFLIPKYIESIDEAISLITPLEAKDKIDVIRINEYFLIPDKGPELPKFSKDHLISLLINNTSYFSAEINYIAERIPKHKKHYEALVKKIPRKSPLGDWEITQNNVRYVQRDQAWHRVEISPCELLK
jgi:hypothetical protein